MAKEIEEGNEKGGEMYYNSTGAMWTGTWDLETQTVRGNMLRISSCSGLIMAEDEFSVRERLKYVNKLLNSYSSTTMLR